MRTTFDTWWENEGSKKSCGDEYLHDFILELCRTAWENGAYCERERLGRNETTEDELVVHPMSFGFGTHPPTQFGPGPHDWHGTPPQQPGTYEFSCGETDYEVEIVVVEHRNAEDDTLWATIGGEYRPVDMWHEGLTSPAWRTPEPDWDLGDTMDDTTRPGNFVDR